MRVSDVDRQKAIDRLRRHCAAGRLDVDEYAIRLEKAMEATTFEELEGLLSDMPLISVAGPAGYSVNGSESVLRSRWRQDQTGRSGSSSGPRSRLVASALVLLSVVVVCAAVALALVASTLWALVLIVGWLVGVTQGRLSRR
jgi:hypothetical protein